MRSPTSSLDRLSADRRGAVAILVALAIVPMVFAAGIAIDFSRGRATQAQMQAAADMAALTAAQAYDCRDPASSETVRAVAERLVDRAFTQMSLVRSSKTVSWDAGTRRVRVQVAGKVKALLPFLVHADDVDVAARAEVEALPSPLNYFEIVVVLDATGSMKKLIDDAQASAKNFEPALTTALAARGYSVDRIRMRAIYFRDFDPPDMRPVPIVSTPFLEIPSQLATLQTFIDAGEAKGGGNIPEAGLEAFYTALDSPWTKPVEDEIQVFPIIAIWTDAPADDPGDAHNISHGGALYPADMPRSYTALRTLWDNDNVIPQANKRAVLFGPSTERGWRTVTQWPGWTVGGNIWDTSTDLANRLADVIASTLPEKSPPPRLTQ